MMSNKIKNLNDSYTVLVLSQHCGWCQKLINERLEDIKETLQKAKIKLFLIYDGKKNETLDAKYYNVDKCIQNTQYVPSFYLVRSDVIYRLETEINSENINLLLHEISALKKK